MPSHSFPFRDIKMTGGLEAVVRGEFGGAPV